MRGGGDRRMGITERHDGKTGLRARRARCDSDGPALGQTQFGDGAAGIAEAENQQRDHAHGL
jgi:hypothetical protein